VQRGLASLSIAALLATLAACSQTATPRERPNVAAPAPALAEFEATAYSIEGKTASGTRSREGTCAADPNVLPLGSRIRVHRAGPYSGEYVVSDTGRHVKGHRIDIYLADDAAAKRFGRKTVQVEVLSSAK
jgi:3D (Asp-Asp-Asp) domain-containing protein